MSEGKSDKPAVPAGSIVRVRNAKADRVSALAAVAHAQPVPSLAMSAFDVAPMGVCLTDGRDRILYLNRSFLPLLDLPANFTMASSPLLSDHVNRAEFARILAMLSRVRSTGQPASEPRYRHDGLSAGRSYWSMTISPARTPCGDEGLLICAVDISAQIEARVDVEKIERAAAEDLDRLWNRSPVPMCVVDFDGRYGCVNAAYEALLGRSSRELKACSVITDLHPDDEPRAAEAWSRMLAGESTAWEIRRRHADGKYRWIRYSCPAAREGEASITLEARDVTDRRRMEDTLFQSERSARQTLDTLETHVAILDGSGVVLSVNRAWRDFAQKAGRGSRNCGVGENYIATCEALGGALASVGAIREVLQGNRDQFSHEYSCARGDEQFWFVVNVNRFTETGPPRVVVSHEDVTGRRKMEERLRHDSLHDTLTGLPNRSLFHDRVERCIEQKRRRREYRFAVLYLDVDRFKMINDSLGHTAGDELLVTIAARIQLCLRGTDCVTAGIERLDSTVARLGGDEFTVLLGDLKNDGDAVEVAERIQAELSKPIQFAGHEINTTVSIGVVEGSGTYRTAKELLRDADVAMYKAKTAGKARHAVFDATMHAEAVRRLRIESDLRKAIERNELTLNFQPIVSLQTRQLKGFETLVRWRRAGKLLDPGDFIPIAEESGLILSLGAWVLTEAARQLHMWRARWPQAGSLTLSVNVSRRQLLDPELVNVVGRVLGETGLPPHCIKLEITESIMMEESAVAFAALEKLRVLGVGLHIDDFGTGYSSLSCLHKLPISGLKIDRTFITHMKEKRDYAAVVNAIVQLAHNLRMEVIAEGVESLEQIAMLQALDCDLCQGYYFSTPLDRRAAEKYLLAQDDHADTRSSALAKSA